MSCEKCGKTRSGQNYCFSYAKEKREFDGIFSKVWKSADFSGEAFICDRCVSKKDEFSPWIVGMWSIVFLAPILGVQSTYNALGLETAVLEVVLCCVASFLCGLYYYRSLKRDNEYYHKKAIKYSYHGRELAIEVARKRLAKDGFNKFW
jgi:hypothetical protein